MKKAIGLFIKGIPIGVSNTLPGISGGTIALLLNIYEELLYAIKTLRLSFLIPLAAGAFMAIVLTASAMSYLLEHHGPFIHSVLFFLILASSLTTLKEVHTPAGRYVLAGLLSFALTALVAQNSTAVASGGDTSLFLIVISGILSSGSMILPGISGATVLIMLGTYETMLHALLHLDWKILIIFSLSALLGILAIASLLLLILQKHRVLMMAVLSGLILGSSLAVIPRQISLEVLWGFFTAMAVVLLFRWGLAAKP